MATSVPVTSVPGSATNRKSRHTLFVINNWDKADMDSLITYAESDEPRYICWSEEVGEQGTPHIQGYVAWTSPRSLRKFKSQISYRLHYGDSNGNTNGTAQQNRNYCLGMVEKKGFKANPTFVEYGEIPTQGERTDWKEAVSHLQTGTPVSDVVVSQPHLLPTIRALERFQQLSNKPLNRPVEVYVLVGKPGTGKSRWAYDNYPELYSKPDGHWYDGYTGQKTLLLDDYYGDIPYSQLLKVCDRYPLQVPVKGGFIYAQWTTVIITSNRMPDRWYPGLDISAFERRITNIKEEYNHAEDPKASYASSLSQTPSVSSSSNDASSGCERCA